MLRFSPKYREHDLFMGEWREKNIFSRKKIVSSTKGTSGIPRNSHHLLIVLHLNPLCSTVQLEALLASVLNLQVLPCPTAWVSTISVASDKLICCLQVTLSLPITSEEVVISYERNLQNFQPQNWTLTELLTCIGPHPLSFACPIGPFRNSWPTLNIHCSGRVGISFYRPCPRRHPWWQSPSQSGIWGCKSP